MENKVYEVTITTTEYKELIREAAENRKEAEMERDRRWKAETELKTVKAELDKVKLELEEKNAELRVVLERLEKYEANKK